MARYRRSLPHTDGRPIVIGGGIETALLFHAGLELPEFAAFDLLERPGGDAALTKYFRSYAAVARDLGVGLILESATWRASSDWGARLGYSREKLADVNRRAIALLEEIRAEAESDRT